MKILIVDDEPPARERLKHLVSELANCELAGEAANGEEALASCTQLRPDVVLMDIRMPGMDGVEAARHLSALEEPPAVIFTTAFGEYAIDAFDAQAIGYLMKPIRRERLARALKQATRLTRPQLIALAESEKTISSRHHICARVRDELKLVPLQDILYFRADQKYVTVRHKDGEVLIDEPLKALAEEFAADFLRIHRNALVALRFLESVERDPGGHYFARLKGIDEPLAVSRRHATELRRRVRSGQ